MIYRSAEKMVCMGPIIFEHQEHLTYVGSSYLAVFCQLVPTNDNSLLLVIMSKCITVPFEGPSPLLESTYRDRFLCDCRLNSLLEIC